MTAVTSENPVTVTEYYFPLTQTSLASGVAPIRATEHELQARVGQVVGTVTPLPKLYASHQCFVAIMRTEVRKICIVCSLQINE